MPEYIMAEMAIPSEWGSKDNLKAECFAVKAVCDAYGYGNVMEWASALWRHKVIKDGHGRGVAETGCFVPTCPSFIKEEFRYPEQRAMYDKMAQEILGNPEAQ